MSRPMSPQRAKNKNQLNQNQCKHPPSPLNYNDHQVGNPPTPRGSENSERSKRMNDNWVDRGTLVARLEDSHTTALRAGTVVTK